MKGLVWVTVLAVSMAEADENSVRLQEGPGKDLVSAQCVMCHSLDYIQMNSVILDRQGWEKTVGKMIKVMGAPIEPDDVAPIVEYLIEHYGK